MNKLRGEEIRARGFEWPGPVGDYAVTGPDGAVDLDATRQALERSLSFHQGELDAMRAFRDRWRADWADVTDRREECTARVDQLRRAIQHIRAILGR